jgi:hypothetical protein
VEQNPYASPRVNVVGAEGVGEPSGWLRAKWIFGGLWAVLTLLSILNGILTPPPEPNWAVLLLNSVIAIAVVGLIGREMWLLKVRHAPLIVDIAIYVAVIGGLIALMFVKETGVYVWNDLHLDVPIFLLMGGLAITAWFTESKKGVRVYVGARNLIFTRNDVGL